MVTGPGAWGGLQKADGALYDAAEYGNEMIGQVLAVRNSAGGMKSVPAFAGLQSGSQLIAQLNKSLPQLEQQLGKHHSMLTEMVQKFTAAGKAYDRTDQASRELFDKLAVANSAGSLTGTAPKPQGASGLEQVNSSWQTWDSPTVINVGDYDGFNGFDTLVLPAPTGEPSLQQYSVPTDVSHYQGARQEPEQMGLAQVQAENPYSLSWNTLYQVGQSIERIVEPLRNQAAMWKYLAGQMENAGSRLTSQVKALGSSGQWASSGATAALTATQKYGDEVTALSSAMRTIGDNQNYTAGFLNDVVGYMPATPNPPVTTGNSSSADMSAAQTAQNELNTAREAMANIYVPGVKTASSDIPVVPTLVNPMPATTPPGTTTKKSSPASGSTGTPSVGGGSGGVTTDGTVTPVVSTTGLTTDPTITGNGASTGSGTATTSGSGADTSGTGTDTSTGTGTDTSGTGASSGTGTDTSGTGTDTSGTGTNTPSGTGTDTSSSSSGLDSLSQLASAGQQAVNGAQQVSSAVQQAQQAAQARQALGDSSRAAAALGNLGGASAALRGGGAGGAGLGGVGDTASALGGPAASQASLFPRASLIGNSGAAEAATAEEATAAEMVAARAGAAPMTPYPPGGMGGAGQQGQARDHKRPRGLDSAAHLEEAFGDPPSVAKPVVDQR